MSWLVLPVPEMQMTSRILNVYQENNAFFQIKGGVHGYKKYEHSVEGELEKEVVNQIVQI